jgi:DNA-binding CsgD family transcriptional regulator
VSEPGADFSEPYLSGWVGGGPTTFRLPAGKDVATVGRAGSADIRIEDDEQVSRLHARLERVGGEWSVVDDGLSRNGTYVNGRRVTHRVRLHDRDRITVGRTSLTFCAPPVSAAEQTMVGDVAPPVGRLTPAQQAVLAALCRPCLAGGPYTAPASNDQIARELSISVDGVKTHLRVLFHKFGVGELPQNQKRSRLVELAVRWGLAGDG